MRRNPHGREDAGRARAGRTRPLPLTRLVRRGGLGTLSPRRGREEDPLTRPLRGRPLPDPHKGRGRRRNPPPRPSSGRGNRSTDLKTSRWHGEPDMVGGAAMTGTPRGAGEPVNFARGGLGSITQIVRKHWGSVCRGRNRWHCSGTDSTSFCCTAGSERTHQSRRSGVKGNALVRPRVPSLVRRP